MSRVEATTHILKDGRELLIREAAPDDAEELLEYLETISRESSYISISPGEFELSVDEEAAFVEKMRLCEHALYLVGVVDGELAGGLHFESRNRNRVRHCGEFGMSVREESSGRGIGGLLLDALIDWGRRSAIVTKINLRVRTDNERAIHLYESRGFGCEGTISRDFVVEGV